MKCRWEACSSRRHLEPPLGPRLLFRAALNRRWQPPLCRPSERPSLHFARTPAPSHVGSTVDRQDCYGFRNGQESQGSIITLGSREAPQSITRHRAGYAPGGRTTFPLPAPFPFAACGAYCVPPSIFVALELGSSGNDVSL